MRIWRIHVDAYEQALIFRNKELIDVLDPGKHWIDPSWTVVKMDVTESFYHEIELELLLQCKALQSRLNVVEVAENEMALEYKDGLFRQVLTPGKYAYWKNGVALTHQCINLDDVDVDSEIPRQVLSYPQVAKYLTVHDIQNYELGLLYVEGELVKQLHPGRYYFWKGSKNVIISKIDTRQQQMEVSGQELLTADKAAVRMSLFAHYQVVDMVKALSMNRDFAKQLYVILQLGLREYVGQFSLDQLLKNKTSIAPFILDYAKSRAEELGVELMDCGLRDIILPGEIKEIMNQVLVAEKKAQANTIMRREETASTRSLLNTAKLMEDNEMLFKLKEMEYMEKIADKIGEISVNGGGHVLDQLKIMVGGK